MQCAATLTAWHMLQTVHPEIWREKVKGGHHAKRYNHRNIQASLRGDLIQRSDADYEEAVSYTMG